MTVAELRDRVNKSEENVAKAEKTIEYHKKQAQKKLDIINQNNWKLDKREYASRRDDEGSHAYWTIVEYEEKLDDIERCTKKLKEVQKTCDNWKAKLARQIELQTTLQTKVPEAFKSARDELVEMWTRWDIYCREKMLKKKEEVRKEFGEDDYFRKWRKIYSFTEEESLKHTDEEFRSINEKDADVWLLDLYNRVYAITGEITDCAGVRWGGKCLDGKVIGKEGVAIVSTIEAGGYNVQRWHLRTLVTEYKGV